MFFDLHPVAYFVARGHLPTTLTEWLAWCASILFLLSIYPTRNHRYRSFRVGRFGGSWGWDSVHDNFINRERYYREDPSHPESLSFRARVHGILENLNVLQRRDAAWKIESLIEGSKKFFHAVKHGFAQCDTNRLQVLLHSELFAKWKLSQASYSSATSESSYSIERVDIVSFQDKPGEEYDYFTVRIEASKGIHTASLPGSASSLRQKSVEFWTFARERRAWRLLKMESEEQYRARAS